MTGKLRSTASGAVDCRTIWWGPCFRMTAGESGFPRIAGLPISKMAGLLPSALCPAGSCTPSPEIARGISGSATPLTVSFICWGGVWSNRFLGRSWEVATTLLHYFLILRGAVYGLDFVAVV